MSNEFWASFATIMAIIISRILSHIEHKKTNRMLNGGLEKQIEAAVKKALNEKKL